MVNPLTASLKCLQINLQHKKVATTNLANMIRESNIDLAFIQEPYTINNKVAGIPKTYRTYSNGSERKRAAIIANNKEMDVILINQLSDEDCVVVEIRSQQDKIYAASVYCDITKDIGIDIRKIENIINHAQGVGTIICVDSNSRNTLWHDTVTNRRGEILEDFLLTSNLYVMNENVAAPTFETIRGKSRIDLTICNSLILGYFEDWRCGEEESCCDHNNITFKINIKKGYYCGETENYTGYRFNTKTGDMTKFDDRLKANVVNKFQCKEIENEDIQKELLEKLKNAELVELETIIHNYQSCIVAACNEAFKKCSRGNFRRGRTVPWWTQELTILRKKVNALRRRFQRTMNNEDLRMERKGKYLDGKRIYEMKLHYEKLSSWKKYCTLTEGSNPWNAIYKIAAGKLRSPTSLTTLLKPDGTFTADTASTINLMIHHFTPDDDPLTDNQHQREIRELMNEEINTEDDREFTQEEIIRVLKKFDPKKAPGEDGLTSEILFRAFRHFPKFTTEMYNECLSKGLFPRIWKTSVIIPIAKPGKEDSKDASKFRPISLLNIGGKVLEKLMIDRILHHINTKKKFNTNQYGFTPQKSTIDAAMAVKETIEENTLMNFTIVVSLDVKGAFDAAWWPGIMANLRELQCPRNLYRLSRNYFSQRKASLRLNTYKIEKELTKGCPQGSCCGPGFWNVLYNSLLNLKFTDKTKVIAFADDLVILTKGQSIAEAENFANQDLKKIENWAKSYKIHFNSEKSKVLLVTRRRIGNNGKVRIYMNHQPLEQVKTMKYLGIFLDSRLTFDRHIEYVSQKCTGLIHQLTKSARLQWGLGHEALKTIYQGAIIPVLVYGAPVWEKALTKGNNIKKYQRVQRLINIKMAKAYRTLSYDASCIIAGVEPIKIIIEEKINIYKATHGLLQEYDEPVDTTQWMHPAEIIEICEATNEQYEIEVFTDGSKINGKVGAAAVIFRNKTVVQQQKFRLNNKCSNNQAEQIAILQALKIITEMDIPNIERTVAIYTDSKVTIDLLRNNDKHGYIIEQIRQNLKILFSQHWKINFKWIKAHVGIHGNEIADKLAKQATEEDHIPVIYNKIPKSTIIDAEKKKSTEKWQRMWSNTTKGALTKRFFPSVTDRMKINIPATPNLASILTGHGKLRSYYYRFRISENPGCPCGAPDQTVDHLLWDCQILNQQRSVFKEATRSGRNWPINYRDIIKQHLRSFVHYINAINFEQL